MHDSKIFQQNKLLFTINKVKLNKDGEAPFDESLVMVLCIQPGDIHTESLPNRWRVVLMVLSETLQRLQLTVPPEDDQEEIPDWVTDDTGMEPTEEDQNDPATEPPNWTTDDSATGIPEDIEELLHAIPDGDPGEITTKPPDDIAELMRLIGMEPPGGDQGDPLTEPAEEDRDDL